MNWDLRGLLKILHYHKQFHLKSLSMQYLTYLFTISDVKTRLFMQGTDQHFIF